MKILVDIEERRSPVPTYLSQLDVTVDMVTLPVGDYLIGDRKAVERKTIADFHRSIATSRLWCQVAALARMDRAYLLLEGPNLDVGPISPRGVRGAVLQIIDNGIAVIHSTSASDSAVWLRLTWLAEIAPGRSSVGGAPICWRLATRSSRVHARNQPNSRPAIARAIRLGCGVAAAAPEGLQEIEGIGTRRADVLSRS